METDSHNLSSIGDESLMKQELVHDSPSQPNLDPTMNHQQHQPHPNNTSTPLSQTQAPPSIIIPFEDFAQDLEQRLGRANGNIYIRQPGVPNVHDGQIMIRLKKKRFIIVDYSFIPTPRDVAAAALSPQILCPNGAGKQKCITRECTKVGVPVMLYDSDPEQTSSLYMRSGLCFTCQRILNEKRRTQRKRKGDVVGVHGDVVRVPNENGENGGGGHHHHHHHIDGSLAAASNIGTDAAGTINNNNGGYHIEPPQKRFRLHEEIVDLNPDAIIINGPQEGTRHHQPGYEYPEITNDLQAIANDAIAQTNRLAAAVQSLSPTATVTADMEGGAEIVAARDEMLASYESAFLGMSRGVFLLSQWKASWDAAVAVAAAEKVAIVAAQREREEHEAREIQEREEHGQVDRGVLEPAAVADAVASAAAVAAAQSQTVGTDSSAGDVGVGVVDGVSVSVVDGVDVSDGVIDGVDVSDGAGVVDGVDVSDGAGVVDGVDVGVGVGVGNVSGHPHGDETMDENVVDISVGANEQMNGVNISNITQLHAANHSHMKLEDLSNNSEVVPNDEVVRVDEIGTVNSNTGVQDLGTQMNSAATGVVDPSERDIYTAV